MTEATFTAQWPAAPFIDADRSASVRCQCGASLPAQRTGRRRSTCSPRCKAQRDALVRKLRRREQWVMQWSAVDVRRGDYTAARVHHEVETLTAEVDAITRQLHGGSEQEWNV